MRPIVQIFAIVALTSTSLLAQERPAARVAQAIESFETVNQEFQDEVKAGIAEYRAAQLQAVKNGNGKGFKFGKPFPAARYSPRFLAIAEKNPEGPDAIDAIRMTLKTSISEVPKPGTVLETRAKALKILADHYVTKPAIKGFLGTLISYDDEASKDLVAEVIARNPERRVQAAAYKEQIANRVELARYATVVKNPKRLALAERVQGKEVVRDKLAKAEKARLEIAALQKTLDTEYSDLFTASVGNVAPEIEIQSVDGKDARGYQLLRRQGRRTRHLGDLVRPVRQDDSPRTRDG